MKDDSTETSNPSAIPLSRSDKLPLHTTTGDDTFDECQPKEMPRSSSHDLTAPSTSDDI